MNSSATQAPKTPRFKVLRPSGGFTGSSPLERARGPITLHVRPGASTAEDAKNAEEEKKGRGIVQRRSFVPFLSAFSVWALCLPCRGLLKPKSLLPVRPQSEVRGVLDAGANNRMGSPKHRYIGAVVG